MSAKLVRELMVPLENYGVISQENTLSEALQEFRSAYGKIQSDRQPPRAVLVSNETGEIVGQLGHLDILKALEPKYSLLGDLKALAQAGLSAEFINSMMTNYRMLQDSLPNLCRSAMNLKVKEIMRPATESIDENALITEAMHKIVLQQSRRLLVTRNGKVVGVIRLADLFAEVEQCVDSLRNP
ncbi:MAG: CBS domain-containing protein [bacterium]